MGLHWIAHPGRKFSGKLKDFVGISLRKFVVHVFLQVVSQQNSNQDFVGISLRQFVSFQRFSLKVLKKSYFPLCFRLRSVFGSLWEVFGDLRGSLETLWASLGGLWGSLGDLWGSLGTLWGLFRPH